jgi:hypothetical protein
MKTFKDLIFNPHTIADNSSHAVCEFENGYGVSVISGPRFYTDTNHPYELAILYKGAISYNTGITDDVIGHLTSKQVTYYMKKVQAL